MPKPTSPAPLLLQSFAQIVRIAPSSGADVRFEIFDEDGRKALEFTPEDQHAIMRFLASAENAR